MDQRYWTAVGKVPLRPWRAGETVGAEPTPSAASDHVLSELDDRLVLAEQRALAAERERDWWRAQHDAVMEDWRLDVAHLQALKASAAAQQPGRTPDPALTPPTNDGLRHVLELLQFFNLQDGSIAFRKGEQVLSDAFRRAAAWAAGRGG